MGVDLYTGSTYTSENTVNFIRETEIAMLTRNNCQLPSLFTDFKIQYKNTKIVIFYFTDSLVWYNYANVIIHLSVREKPRIIFTLPHLRLGEYPGLFTSTLLNNCSLNEELGAKTA